MFSAMSGKRLLFGLGVVIVLGAAGLGYYLKVYIPAHELTAISQPLQALQTSTVYQGDLVVYARGTGTLIASDEIMLGFGTSGPISELNIAAGDPVHAGDVLAVQGDRDHLEAAVAADQLSMMHAQVALDAFYANADIASAQAALDLANAQDALRNAERKWQNQQAGYRAGSVTIKAAEAELKLAKSSMEHAKGEYDQYSGRPSDDPGRAQAYKNYAAAYQRYQIALGNVNWYTGHPTEIQQAQLDGEVALAAARLAQAQQAWETIKDRPDPGELALLELQLASAQADLNVSQRNLDESIIAAPSDGTVISVTESAGHDVSGTFITIADLSQLYLDIWMDAADLEKIGLGSAVEVTFDALPGQIFTGLVVKLQPSLSTADAFPTIKGLVLLDANDAGSYGNLMLGLRATVDVIAGRASRALIVPVEALREQAPGEYAVYVVEAGQTVLRRVEVGLKDSAFVEIKSGLQVGEVVSTGVVQNQ